MINAFIFCIFLYIYHCIVRPIRPLSSLHRGMNTQYGCKIRSEEENKVRWSRSNSRYSFIIQNKRAISTWEINATVYWSATNTRKWTTETEDYRWKRAGHKLMLF